MVVRVYIYATGWQQFLLTAVIFMLIVQIISTSLFAVKRISYVIVTMLTRCYFWMFIININHGNLNIICKVFNLIACLYMQAFKSYLWKDAVFQIIKYDKRRVFFILILYVMVYPTFQNLYEIISCIFTCNS